MEIIFLSQYHNKKTWQKDFFYIEKLYFNIFQMFFFLYLISNKQNILLWIFFKLIINIYIFVNILLILIFFLCFFFIPFFKSL